MNGIVWMLPLQELPRIPCVNEEEDCPLDGLKGATEAAVLTGKASQVMAQFGVVALDGIGLLLGDLVRTSRIQERRVGVQAIRKPLGRLGCWVAGYNAQTHQIHDVSRGNCSSRARLSGSDDDRLHSIQVALTHSIPTDNAARSTIDGRGYVDPVPFFRSRAYISSNSTVSICS